MRDIKFILSFQLNGGNRSLVHAILFKSISDIINNRLHYSFFTFAEIKIRRIK